MALLALRKVPLIKNVQVNTRKNARFEEEARLEREEYESKHQFMSCPLRRVPDVMEISFHLETYFEQCENYLLKRFDIRPYPPLDEALLTAVGIHETFESQGCDLGLVQNRRHNRSKVVHNGSFLPLTNGLHKLYITLSGTPVPAGPSIRVPFNIDLEILRITCTIPLDDPVGMTINENDNLIYIANKSSITIVNDKGKKMNSLVGHFSEITDIAIAPDNSHLYIIAHDGISRINMKGIRMDYIGLRGYDGIIVSKKDGEVYAATKHYTMHGFMETFLNVFPPDLSHEKLLPVTKSIEKIPKKMWSSYFDSHSDSSLKRAIAMDDNGIIYMSNWDGGYIEGVLSENYDKFSHKIYKFDPMKKEDNLDIFIDCGFSFTPTAIAFDSNNLVYIGGIKIVAVYTIHGEHVRTMQDDVSVGDLALFKGAPCYTSRNSKQLVMYHNSEWPHESTTPPETTTSDSTATTQVTSKTKHEKPLPLPQHKFRSNSLT